MDAVALREAEADGVLFEHWLYSNKPHLKYVNAEYIKVWCTLSLHNSTITNITLWNLNSNTPIENDFYKWISKNFFFSFKYEKAMFKCINV